MTRRIDGSPRSSLLVAFVCGVLAGQGWHKGPMREVGRWAQSVRGSVHGRIVRYRLRSAYEDTLRPLPVRTRASPVVLHHHCEPAFVWSRATSLHNPQSEASEQRGVVLQYRLGVRGSAVEVRATSRSATRGPHAEVHSVIVHEPTPHSELTSLESVGDVDGDALDDVVLLWSTRAGQPSLVATVSLHLGLANGFEPNPSFVRAFDGELGATRAIAVNLDGAPGRELIVATPGPRGSDHMALAALRWTGHAGGRDAANTMAPVALDGRLAVANAARLYDAGDVDRDGYGDIAVLDANDGDAVLTIWRGAPAGLESTPVWRVDKLGWRVRIVALDVDQDGFDDLAVGEPSFDPRSGADNWIGRVRVFRGSPAGLRANPWKTLVGETPDDHLGAALFVLGGPGGHHPQLLIGSSTGNPGEGTSEWHAFVAGRHTLDRAAMVFQHAIGPSESGFTNALAAVDFDRDGFDDLMIVGRSSSEAYRYCYDIVSGKPRG